MKSCKNCESKFEGNFCSNCGQKYIDKRLTLKESVLWVFTSVFNLEKGFFYTSWLMVIHPGKVINEFLKGITIRYFHPFRFVFIWATLAAIIALYTNMLEQSSAIFGEFSQKQAESEFSKMWLNFMKHYMSIFTMLMIPLMSLASYLILKRKKYNYAEHLVLNAYANGASILVGLPISVLYFFLDNTIILPSIILILSIVVVGRVYAKTFGDHLIIGILKYLATYTLMMVFFIIVFLIVIIIASLIYASMGWPNPFIPAQG